MRRIICFCLSAVLLAGAFCGCDNKKKPDNDSQPVTEAVTTTAASTEPVDNTGKQFIGKWETYKVSVNGETYETVYADYPLSSVCRLEITDDKKAKYYDNLNPRGKERVFEYNWGITVDDDGNDVLHLMSPDERFDCTVSQGEMKMINAYMGDDSDIYYLLPVSEFTVVETTTEAGLDKVDYSKFMGKWEAAEITMDEEVYTDTLGDYPVNVSFQLEMKKDNTAVMTVLNSSQTYEWEPEKKDQLYMWNDMEGFAMTMQGSMLVLDNENAESRFILKLKKVDEFTEYDFEAAANSIPDENIILEPEEETTT